MTAGLVKYDSIKCQQTQKNFQKIYHILSNSVFIFRLPISLYYTFCRTGSSFSDCRFLSITHFVEQGLHFQIADFSLLHILSNRVFIFRLPISLYYTFCRTGSSFSDCRFLSITHGLIILLFCIPKGVGLISTCVRFYILFLLI